MNAPATHLAAAGDGGILRALADEVAAIAALPVQKENAALWTRLNGLRSVRPMVHIYQIPWAELEAGDEFLRPRCAGAFCREVETSLRRTIYQWKRLPGDMVVEPRFLVAPVLSGLGFGIEPRARAVHAGSPGSVASREFEVQIRDEADIGKIRMPEIVHDEAATAERVDALEKAFGGALSAVVGLDPGWYSVGPWDKLIQLTGVQEILLDLALRPEYVHRLVDRYVQACESKLDQLERLNLLVLNNNSLVVGEGGPGFCDELPGPDFDPKRVRYSNLWGAGRAQIFSEVSPAMHEEFALAYEKRCLDRFPLVYYGCCEPLHRKVESVRRMLPNVRKISMSPWADAEAGARALGAEVVFSHKPNPAQLAMERWDPALVRSSLRRVLGIARDHGCHTEIVLKDISTVRGEPRRLWEWAEVAAGVAREFAR